MRVSGDRAPSATRSPGCRLLAACLRDGRGLGGSTVRCGWRRAGRRPRGRSSRTEPSASGLELHSISLTRPKCEHDQDERCPRTILPTAAVNATEPSASSRRCQTRALRRGNRCGQVRRPKLPIPTGPTGSVQRVPADARPARQQVVSAVGGTSRIELGDGRSLSQEGGAMSFDLPSLARRVPRRRR